MADLGLERGQLVLDLGAATQRVQLLGDVVAVVSANIFEDARLQQLVQGPGVGLCEAILSCARAVERRPSR